MPVPAQAMHLRKPRRSTPSSLWSSVMKCDMTCSACRGRWCGVWTLPASTGAAPPLFPTRGLWNSPSGRTVLRTYGARVTRQRWPPSSASAPRSWWHIMPSARRTRPMLAMVVAALATPTPSQRAQPTIPSAVLRAGTLSFTAHSTVGDFVGTTASVTGGVAGGTELAAAQGWAEAPVATLATGNSRRDRDMRAALEANRYPTVRLDVKGVRADADVPADSTHAVLRGALAIHGVVRDVEVPATFVRRGDTVHVTSEFPLRLQDYRVGGLQKAFGLLRVRDDVQVRADLRYVVSARPR